MTRSIFTGQYEEFRCILIAARATAGFTQTELAAKLSRPQSYVSKYERGERRLDVIEFLEIARALHIDPGQFIRELEAALLSLKR